MAVLVAGGAGYIGSHTCVELLENSCEIIVVDDLSNSRAEAIARVKRIAETDFPFYIGDVKDHALLERIFREHPIDCVVHFAGYKAVGESVEQPLKYYHNNLNTTLSLCRAMEDHGVNKMVFSSSATVYSENNEMPLAENAATGCGNPYGWSKYMGEQILRDIGAANSWSVILLRYFNPAGAHPSGLLGENPADIPNNLMPYISQVAAGILPELTVFGDDYDTPDGTGLRDYIHVVDLAKAHVAALACLQQRQEVAALNVGTGKGTSVLELVNCYRQINHVAVPYRIGPRRAGDSAVCYADARRACELLKWRAERSLEEMCADDWRWRTCNPKGYEETHP